MSKRNIFNDIASRTGGDIYVGVVGPVRTGKSTFITRFMQNAVLPHLAEADRTRANDELPQSGDGATIMTTQPNFVPQKSLDVKLGGANMRVRMIDCVGYLVPGAKGHEAGGKPRMVKTPWQEGEMTFEAAAELGTRKVITEHSTVAIVITTDGTVGNLVRDNFVEAEERIIKQLKSMARPFVVIVNSKTPTAEAATALATTVSKKHGVPAMAVDVDGLNEVDIDRVFGALVGEFPVSGFRVEMPKWLAVLDRDHEIITEVVETVRAHTLRVNKMVQNKTDKLFDGSLFVKQLATTNIDASTGVITYTVVPHDDLYFRVLSMAAGAALDTDAHLVAFLRHSAATNKSFDKVRTALSAAADTGYGIVAPTFADFTLNKPTLHKKGKNFGLKFSAVAPSLHIVRVDVGATVTPQVGGKKAAEDMLALLNAQYEIDPSSLWPVSVFGKSLESLVTEGISNKALAMPESVRAKMKRSLSKVVNQGKSGVIALMLA